MLLKNAFSSRRIYVAISPVDASCMGGWASCIAACSRDGTAQPAIIHAYAGRPHMAVVHTGRSLSA